MTQFSSDQKQILLGTLLGNSKLKQSKDGLYLVMKSQDIGWLKSKVESLGELPGEFIVNGRSHSWVSAPSHAFDDIHCQIYNKKKKCVRMECLDSLHAIALMVWYGDSGCLVGREKRNACLRTQPLGKGSELVHQYFNEIGVPCRINYVRSSPVVVFDLMGTKTLMRIVAPLLPRSRFHLIPTWLL